MRCPDRKPEYDVLLLAILIGAAVLADQVPWLPIGALVLGALALSAILWAFHRVVILRATITIRNLADYLSQVGILFGVLFALGALWDAIS
jgi:hypothetical protein